MKTYDQYITESLAAKIKEEPKSKVSEQAKKLGLKYLGFGRYGDKSGKVAYIVHNDKLVPFKSAEKAYSEIDKTTNKKDPKAKQKAQATLDAHLQVKEQDRQVYKNQTREADLLDRKLKKIYPTEAFSPDEAQLLYQYTDGAYKQINQYLYGGHAEGTPYGQAAQLEQFVQALDDVFLGKELPIEFSVYSGLSSRYNPQSFVVGQTYIFRGFVSTSLAVERPKDTFTNAKETESKVTLQIDLKKGQKALYIDGVSSFPGEQEVLLPRGSKLRVLSGPHDLPSTEDAEPKSKTVMFHCVLIDEDE